MFLFIIGSSILSILFAKFTFYVTGCYIVLLQFQPLLFSC